MGPCTKFWYPYIWLMVVSWPGNCFISYAQRKNFSNIPRLDEEIWTWSYRHRVLYVKPRYSKDRLKYNLQKPALWRPSLHIGTIPTMIKLWGQCWGCIYSIGFNVKNYQATSLFWVDSLAFGQTYFCPNASEATLKDISKRVRGYPLKAMI